MSLKINMVKPFQSIPIPSGISYLWNFGSLLGTCLSVQIISGLFLAMRYESSLGNSFDSVIAMMNNVNFGWFVRLAHANGASMFFVLAYVHIGRSMYYGGYKNKLTWSIGVFMLLLMMGIAFLGYVLPWGQMSYWGATVITNLLSAIPYFGPPLVEWVWGGFSVSNPTLVRMFSLHFLLPFVLVGLSTLHLFSLHMSGSSNPLGVRPDYDKLPFHPIFTHKDFISLSVVILLFLAMITLFPTTLMDDENWLFARPDITPPAIEPEWYFLFAYSILRSIPNKLGGVLALISSVLVLLGLMMCSGKYTGAFSVGIKGLTLIQLINFTLLTWLGGMPVEYPFVHLAQFVSIVYFSVFLLWIMVF